MTKPILILTALSLLLAPVGCIKKREQARSSPFKETESEYILAIVLDMSGSFAEHMQDDDPRAYDYFMRITQKFFRERMEQTDRVLLVQLSTGDPLLWDGPPTALKSAFPTSQAFGKFLQDKSGGGSMVYSSIADTLDYLTTRQGVTDNTRLLTVVLSDLLDNDPDGQAAKVRLESALDRYHQKDGYLAFYWAHQSVIPDWRKMLSRYSGRSLICSSIEYDPPMPNFDD